MSERSIRADELRHSDVGKKATVTHGFLSGTAPIRYITLHESSITVSVRIEDEPFGKSVNLSLEPTDIITIHDDPEEAP